MTKPHQMRRHARRMRRYGLQPMVVINDGNQLPELIIVLIGRWLWRYRSELGPVYLTLTAVAVSWVLHASHPGWWPLMLVLAAAIAGVVIGLGGRLGLAHASERVYAATVALATGGWLAAATAFGPWHSLLPRLLLGAVVLAVPWWANRRRRARVAVERKLAAWPDIARSIGLAGSRVMSAVVDAWGFSARIALRRGHTVADALGRLPAVESALGTRPGAVRIEGDPNRANHLLMRVLDTDPHASPIPWKPSGIRSITQPIPLGVFEDATTVNVLFLRRHGLIGGVVGSGKSGVLNVILAALAACEDVVIWGIDLKGGMELRPWVPSLGRLATTPQQAVTLLADAVAELERRAEQSGHDGTRVWEPTRQHPALIILVDEYAELPEEATKPADSIARRGRAVAVTLLAATQRPTQKAMGHGATRSQMDIRISLRVRERRDVDLILGQGMFNSGWHAHKLDAPGKFLISAPGHPNPKRARAYLITDDDVEATARRHSTDRPVLNPPHAAHDDDPEIGPQDASQRSGDGYPELVSERTDPPEERLWRALLDAPADGISASRLAKITGMSRRTVYRRLDDHVRAGRAIPTRRGHYRAARPGDGHVT